MSSTRPTARSPRAGDERRAQLAKALGADESAVLTNSETLHAEKQGAEAITRLAEEVAGRLRSTGGRPSDPNWTLTRQVPFALSTWSRLGRLADDLSARGRRVAPTQLAAILVENGLAVLDDDDASPAALDRHLERRGRGTADTDG